MAKIAAFYYSQTGQGLNILQSVSQPLIEDGNKLIIKEIVPETPFPFPWTAESFFQAFPESRQGIACPLLPIDLRDVQDADLVIIVYPTWFLSPSIPTHGFFQDPAIREFLKDKPVLTIDGCRNMWVMSHRKVRSYIEQSGGRLVGHIVLQDRNPNLISVITIVRWLFGGKKEKSGIFPAAGVSPEDIKQASVFGDIIAETVASGSGFQTLQENLMANEAINYKPHIVFIEKTGHRMFGLFSKWILKKAPYNAPQRKFRLKVFQYYLFAVLYLVSPIGLLFFFLAYPFRYKAIQKDKLMQCSLFANMKKKSILFCLFILSLFFSSCKKEQTYYESSGEIFKTGFHIKYKFDRELDDEIRDCLYRFDLSLNPFNKKSIIYKVNNNEPVEVDDRFIAVFNKAMEVSEISGGTYDITCAPLVNLWGFGYNRPDSISQATIDSLKQFVGYKKVHLEGRKVVKDDPRLQLIASSIAKGYSCDVIAELLESHGITDYLVEIGGEIHAKGKNSKGLCWKVEIPKPIDNLSNAINERMDVVELCDQSIATSGNYRNYHIKDGKKYGHTINPLTGYPAESNILSASVIYFDCMTADAFATVFMTMDLEKALRLANQIPGMNCVFIYIDAEGNLREEKSSLR